MKKRIHINGQYWQAIRGWLPWSKAGECDYAKKTITVSDKLTPIESLGTALHEGLHAIYPDMCEEAVQRGEYGLMQVLRAYGLVRLEDD